MKENFIESTRKQLLYYKSLGEKTIAQLSDDEIHWQPNEASNSVAIIVKHIAGNMLSRWTNFFTEDGEKSWRNRDDEFVDSFASKQEMLECWNKAWEVFLDTLNEITPENIETIIYIRNEGHTAMEAINRQLCHYPYHIGQMVQLGKWIKNESWQSLSIPKGKSGAFNQDKFSREKERKHFTEGS